MFGAALDVKPGRPGMIWLVLVVRPVTVGSVVCWMYLSCFRCFQFFDPWILFAWVLDSALCGWVHGIVLHVVFLCCLWVSHGRLHSLPTSVGNSSIVTRLQGTCKRLLGYCFYCYTRANKSVWSCVVHEFEAPFYFWMCCGTTIECWEYALLNVDVVLSVFLFCAPLVLVCMEI